ncbi:hypothetical protein PMI38_01092 [Pseudomonas sp. GM84]|uniref:hypothetical protein n=1 Tax=Pseudomonas sp. GM84 TaxID=1144340 RepID=UPI00026F8A7F|nr:hypothetical protein [Pseudomonas sp. GM84]EJN39396.1 hypothetical protein PMI38_01092 [Pseudomonas sp. GM84]
MIKKATTPAIFTLLLLPLYGCSTPSTGSTGEWEVSTIEPIPKKSPPKRAGKCRKRGCDNHRLIFNPAEKPPSATDLHRDW